MRWQWLKHYAGSFRLRHAAATLILLLEVENIVFKYLIYRKCKCRSANKLLKSMTDKNIKVFHSAPRQCAKSEPN